MRESMGLGTWLKQNRLARIEKKIKTLRTRQKHVRRKEEDLAKQLKAGAVTADAAKEREGKLHDERERLTHEINDLMAEEERLRKELEAEGVVLTR